MPGNADSLFQLVQIVYWIALSTWFGGVLFIALVAPVIHRSVRSLNPILPDVLSVNLEGQHATLIGGRVVADLVAQLFRVELICGGVLLLAMVGQAMVSDTSPGSDWLHSNRTAAILRGVLLLIALGAMLFDWRIIWPRTLKHRQTYLDNADEPDVANPALDAMERDRRQSDTLLLLVAGLLLGVIVFSGGISPRATHGEMPLQSRGIAR